MNVVIALDSFKGSCSAQAACAAVARGVLRLADQVAGGLSVVQMPVSDGGEGLLSTLAESPLLGAMAWRRCVCRGPYGQRVDASYLRLASGGAILEMAQCCGLELTEKSRRDVRYASSFGLGELLAAALDDGAREITLGLGGSGTNDGGIGFAQALGARFYDGQGRLIAAPACGADLARVSRVDLSGLDGRLREVAVRASCDVTNPLLGGQGATWVYGRQKGADDAALAALEAGMAHYSQLVSAACGREVSGLAGAGAAGGMGAALMWYAGAQLSPGIDLVLGLLNAEHYLSQADLVLVGEGWLDRQSAFGKAPVGVAAMAARYQVPVIALCGGRDDSSRALYQRHVAAIWSICPRPMTLEAAMENGEALLADAAENALRTFIAGRESAARQCVDSR